MGLLSFQGCSRPLPQRNLLLVTVDTLRADYVTPYSQRQGQLTPTLQALAARGVRFERMWTTAPLTLPAHASILTGLTPVHHGVRFNGGQALPASATTLAEVLQQQGWDTAAFVAAYVLSRRFGLAAGFATYDDRIPLPAYAGVRLEAERPGNEVVDAALAWLSTHQQQRFFLWVHLYEPHAPYVPPAPFRQRYAHDPYAGEVAAADAQVERLTTWLKNAGLEANTVVAVLGDHGEALGEHGEATHGLLLYEPTLHVPCIVAAPGLLPAGKVMTEPVSVVDLAPTLLALIGGQRPPGFAPDGRDLSRHLTHHREPEPAYLFAETLYPQSFGWAGLLAVRRGAWKYVAAPRPELFQLEEDPHEQRNLAKDRSEQLATLHQALERHLAQQAQADSLPLTREDRRQLASLGYIAPAFANRQTAADPKDRLAVFAAFEQAHALRLAGELEKAATILRQALQEDEKNPVLLAELAEVLRQAGRLAEAVATYQRVLEINPADGEARYNLALTLREAGRQAEALQALQAALSLEPTRAELHEALGVALAGQGDFPAAEKEFARACQLEPQNPRTWNNLGNVLREQGKLAEAEAAYQKAIALDPAFAEPWNGLGVVQVQRGQTLQAIESFQRALRLAPENLEALLNVGIAWDEAGQGERAAQAYREFLQRAAGKSEFSQQSVVARQLLARVASHTTLARGQERR